jgi:1-acyl-sn-glycerol-3-phosphate acyltransferase
MLILIFTLIGLLAALCVGLKAGFWLALAVFAGAFLLQALVVFLFLLYLCSRVDQSVPQEEDDPLYRKMGDLILESVLPILRIRIKKTGMEKVPQTGRFLLVCNHCSDSDPIILMREFRKYKLAFISKKENKDMFVIGPMMHKLQCQLINRENDREALKTILKCIQILKEDRASVAVFPEGGILTEDGKLHHFRPGVFKIAQKAQVPVVVCTLKNTLPVVPNIKRLKASHVELDVLGVIDTDTVMALKTVEIAEKAHAMMAQNLGPELLAD